MGISIVCMINNTALSILNNPQSSGSTSFENQSGTLKIDEIQYCPNNLNAPNDGNKRMVKNIFKRFLSHFMRL